MKIPKTATLASTSAEEPPPLPNITPEEVFFHTLELRIKVNENDPNEKFLGIAERALLECSMLEARLILKEANRILVEVGNNRTPITVDVTLHASTLDRILLIRSPAPIPQLPFVYACLQTAFPCEKAEEVEEEDALVQNEEPLVDTIDGELVTSLLDANYVKELKRVFQKQMEAELAQFAIPMERRSLDEERRLDVFLSLIKIRYLLANVPLPALEPKPLLSSFELAPHEFGVLRFSSRDPSRKEVDKQLKLAIATEFQSLSLSRRDRKLRETQARSDVCERNRTKLILEIATHPWAMQQDVDAMTRLGISPPQVLLCEVACVHAKKPGWFLVTPTRLIFECRMWGVALFQPLILHASQCRSVHKYQPSLAVLESLCVRMNTISANDGNDDNNEHVFYLPTVEASSHQLDQVFELIWQVLRMNRTAVTGE